ncbi:hypothetical protein QK637_sNgp2 [dermapteran chu-related virus 142]|uniref:Uncharacterized protein n=1 Tax=dermapteran chu-related virus 142 TaxID=2849726 RepID=A0A7D7F1N1_9VIRU|nr:hypothetical protein QK637_sNgp2 [dermapteran chu-related virus 142]QMP82282.1 hypothetical protein [dermapteran chu-related virus 142]
MSSTSLFSLRSICCGICVSGTLIYVLLNMSSRRHRNFDDIACDDMSDLDQLPSPRIMPSNDVTESEQSIELQLLKTEVRQITANQNEMRSDIKRLLIQQEGLNTKLREIKALLTTLAMSR